jgi:hypothetical protein
MLQLSLEKLTALQPVVCSDIGQPAPLTDRSKSATDCLGPAAASFATSNPIRATSRSKLLKVPATGCDACCHM